MTCYAKFGGSGVTSPRVELSTEYFTPLWGPRGVEGYVRPLSTYCEMFDVSL